MGPNVGHHIRFTSHFLIVKFGFYLVWSCIYRQAEIYFTTTRFASRTWTLYCQSWREPSPSAMTFHLAPLRGCLVVMKARRPKNKSLPWLWIPFMLKIVGLHLFSVFYLSLTTTVQLHYKLNIKRHFKTAHAALTNTWHDCRFSNTRNYLKNNRTCFVVYHSKIHQALPRFLDSPRSQ